MKREKARRAVTARDPSRFPSDGRGAMFLKPQGNRDSAKKHAVEPALQPWVEK